MQFVASSAEDRKLHEKFHKAHTEGVDVGSGFVNTGIVGGGMRGGDRIVMVDCTDSKGRKRKAAECLERVQRELGAVEIPAHEIWEASKGDGDEFKFRSFLYVREGKCVGVLLVERISEAFEVLLPEISTKEPRPSREDTTTRKKTSALAALQARRLAAAKEKEQTEAAAKKPLVLSKTPVPAILGVSRIWTLDKCRGQGIAISLLDTAIKWWNLHVTAQLPASTEKENLATSAAKGRRRIERKGEVAFSQPTVLGTKLARKWVGEMSGWRVYVD
jgi:N-acetyltransferase